MTAQRGDSAQAGHFERLEPGDLVPDPDRPGRLHTVSHVLPDGDLLRVGTIVGRVLIVRPSDGSATWA